MWMTMHRVPLMLADRKAPQPVSRLDPVDEAGLRESMQAAVDADPVETRVHPVIDFLRSQRPTTTQKHGKNRHAPSRPLQPRCPEALLSHSSYQGSSPPLQSVSRPTQADYSLNATQLQAPLFKIPILEASHRRRPPAYKD